MRALIEVLGDTIVLALFFAVMWAVLLIFGDSPTIYEV